jgi:hypothetical protein
MRSLQDARFVNLKLKGLQPKTIHVYADAIRRAANAYIWISIN